MRHRNPNCADTTHKVHRGGEVMDIGGAGSGFGTSELTSLKVKHGNTNAAGSSCETTPVKATFVGLNPELLG
jgi:hypothetical protein